MTILEQIRRRTRSAASALLPVLVFAWMDAAALSCAGMPHGGGAEGTRTNAHCGQHAHGGSDHTRTGAHAPGGLDQARAGGPHAPDEPDQARPEGHVHGEPDHAQAEKDVPVGPYHEGVEHGDAGCRHCPPVTADQVLSSYDADCGTDDGAAADLRGRANGHDPQPALAPVLRLAPIAGLSPWRGRLAESPPPPASTTPLNIRYCVFLI